MSRNIPRVRTWRVTFTHRARPRNWQAFYVLAPTRTLALWEAREQFFGAWMMAHPDYAERVTCSRREHALIAPSARGE